MKKSPLCSSSSVNNPRPNLTLPPLNIQHKQKATPPTPTPTPTSAQQTDIHSHQTLQQNEPSLDMTDIKSNQYILDDLEDGEAADLAGWGIEPTLANLQIPHPDQFQNTDQQQEYSEDEYSYDEDGNYNNVYTFNEPFGYDQYEYDNMYDDYDEEYDSEYDQYHEQELGHNEDGDDYEDEFGRSRFQQKQEMIKRMRQRQQVSNTYSQSTQSQPQTPLQESHSGFNRQPSSSHRRGNHRSTRSQTAFHPLVLGTSRSPFLPPTPHTRRLARILHSFRQSFSRRPPPEENHLFLERFRYILVTSRLLDFNPNSTTSHVNNPYSRESQILQDKKKQLLMGLCGSCNNGLLLLPKSIKEEQKFWKNGNSFAIVLVVVVAWALISPKAKLALQSLNKSDTNNHKDIEKMPNTLLTVVQEYKKQKKSVSFLDSTTVISSDGSYQSHTTLLNTPACETQSSDFTVAAQFEDGSSEKSNQNLIAPASTAVSSQFLLFLQSLWPASTDTIHASTTSESHLEDPTTVAAAATAARSIALLLLAFSFSLFIFAYSRRRSIRLLRIRVLTSTSHLVDSTKPFDAAVSKCLSVIKEIELLSRGYRPDLANPSASTPGTSSSVPSFILQYHQQYTKQHGYSQDKKYPTSSSVSTKVMGKHLRATLSAGLYLLSSQIVDAIKVIVPYCNTLDLDRYLDIYDMDMTLLADFGWDYHSIHHVDSDGPIEKMRPSSYLEGLSFSIPKTEFFGLEAANNPLPKLRVEFQKVQFLRRVLVCCLLSIPLEPIEQKVTEEPEEEKETPKKALPFMSLLSKGGINSRIHRRSKSVDTAILSDSKPGSATTSQAQFVQNDKHDSQRGLGVASYQEPSNSSWELDMWSMTVEVIDSVTSLMIQLSKTLSLSKISEACGVIPSPGFQQTEYPTEADMDSHQSNSTGNSVVNRLGSYGTDGLTSISRIFGYGGAKQKLYAEDNMLKDEEEMDMWRKQMRSINNIFSSLQHIEARMEMVRDTSIGIFLANEKDAESNGNYEEMKKIYGLQLDDHKDDQEISVVDSSNNPRIEEDGDLEDPFEPVERHFEHNFELVGSEIRGLLETWERGRDEFRSVVKDLRTKRHLVQNHGNNQLCQLPELSKSPPPISNHQLQSLSGSLNSSARIMTTEASDGTNIVNSATNNPTYLEVGEDDALEYGDIVEETEGQELDIPLNQLSDFGKAALEAAKAARQSRALKNQRQPSNIPETAIVNPSLARASLTTTTPTKRGNDTSSVLEPQRPTLDTTSANIAGSNDSMPITPNKRNLRMFHLHKREISELSAISSFSGVSSLSIATTLTSGSSNAAMNSEDVIRDSPKDTNSSSITKQRQNFVTELGSVLDYRRNQQHKN